MWSCVFLPTYRFLLRLCFCNRFQSLLFAYPWIDILYLVLLDGRIILLHTVSVWFHIWQIRHRSHWPRWLRIHTMILTYLIYLFVQMYLEFAIIEFRIIPCLAIRSILLPYLCITLFQFIDSNYFLLLRRVALDLMGLKLIKMMYSFVFAFHEGSCFLLS